MEEGREEREKGRVTALISGEAPAGGEGGGNQEAGVLQGGGARAPWACARRLPSSFDAEEDSWRRTWGSGRRRVADLGTDGVGLEPRQADEMRGSGGCVLRASMASEASALP